MRFTLAVPCRMPTWNLGDKRLKLSSRVGRPKTTPQRCVAVTLECGPKPIIKLLRFQQPADWNEESLDGALLGGVAATLLLIRNAGLSLNNNSEANIL